jgi:hypothetical protein
MMRHSSTPGLTAALATIAILLTGCSDDPGTRAGAGEDSPPSSPSGDLVQATRLADVAAADTLLTPGLYAMGFSSDQADAPMVVIDVPAGYRGRGDGYEITAEEGGFRHFDTWTVAEVAAKPCGGTAWVDPGAGVDDLADALAALPVWESTRPAPRTIGGYEGVFMELNVPSDIPAKCQDELLSWREHSGGTQGSGPGKTQRLWIVDVEGHRLMLVAGYFPGPDGPTPKLVEEMTKMAEGATFVDVDQVAP